MNTRLLTRFFYFAVLMLAFVSCNDDEGTDGREKYGDGSPSSENIVPVANYRYEYNAKGLVEKMYHQTKEQVYDEATGKYYYTGRVIERLAAVFQYPQPNRAVMYSDQGMGGEPNYNRPVYFAFGENGFAYKMLEKDEEGQYLTRVDYDDDGYMTRFDIGDGEVLTLEWREGNLVGRKDKKEDGNEEFLYTPSNRTDFGNYGLDPFLSNFSYNGDLGWWIEPTLRYAWYAGFMGHPNKNLPARVWHKNQYGSELGTRYEYRHETYDGEDYYWVEVLDEDVDNPGGGDEPGPGDGDSPSGNDLLIETESGETLVRNVPRCDDPTKEDGVIWVEDKNMLFTTFEESEDDYEDYGDQIVIRDYTGKDGTYKNNSFAIQQPFYGVQGSAPSVGVECDAENMFTFNFTAEDADFFTKGDYGYQPAGTAKVTCENVKVALYAHCKRYWNLSFIEAQRNGMPSFAPRPASNSVFVDHVSYLCRFLEGKCGKGAEMGYSFKSYSPSIEECFKVYVKLKEQAIDNGFKVVYYFEEGVEYGYTVSVKDDKIIVIEWWPDAAEESDDPDTYPLTVQAVEGSTIPVDKFYETEKAQFMKKQLRRVSKQIRRVAGQKEKGFAPRAGR